MHAWVHLQPSLFAAWQGPDKPFFLLDKGYLTHIHTRVFF